MEIGKINGNNTVRNANFKGTEETTMSEYKPQGRCLAERELTNLPDVDVWISQARQETDSSYDIYVTEDFNYQLMGLDNHKHPAVETLEIVNKETGNPKTIVRYVAGKPEESFHYDKNGELKEKRIYRKEQLYHTIDITKYKDGKAKEKEHNVYMKDGSSSTTTEQY